ncbi:M4 family metallopeptidase [Lysobacter sp. A6]|uniref:Neutral metalloproteinase n=1 Tax=Noviluteimonas lactosilytica TaxID=2888523 RepID=A0ABS8JG24_9GAMM|nr:M4 family metallopeptidase [Lysobacter lactosilyticus]MCC8362445.1 M4 family metallopeptidase [Lysobacter lactosilyticus]
MHLFTKLSLLAALTTVAGDALALDNSPTGRALGLLRSHGALASASAHDGFLARDVIVDADGTEHVRFDRSYRGLPVIGGDVVVHSRQGRFRSMSVNQRQPLLLPVRPGRDAKSAIGAAGAAFGARTDGTPESTLVVYARDIEPRLAWQVRLHNAQADMTYVVDAQDRRILDRWSNRETAAVTGKARTLYSGEVALTTNSITGGYELRDPSRGGMRTIDGSNARTSGQVYKDSDNTWGNHTIADVATAAADAQYGAAVTWDYFRIAHGRLGIGGNGKGAYSRVHYGRGYSNAYWSDTCFCMTYGDGDGVHLSPLVALDITGHEMSHGVNSQTANLIYSGESGGLNEANSDILGTMVEFHANNGKDTPDYLIGEEVFIDNVAGSANQMALRYMFKPIADKRSPNCWSSGLGNLDVHYSSGVANLFFYLLAEGTAAKTYSGVNHTPATCNGSKFAGIGRAKAGKIWYRALTVYFTSTTNYAGARAGTISAANDLYGIGSVEARAVATAWSAVSVN